MTEPVLVLLVGVPDPRTPSDAVGFVSRFDDISRGTRFEATMLLRRPLPDVDLFLKAARGIAQAWAAGRAIGDTGVLRDDPTAEAVVIVQDGEEMVARMEMVGR
ncbi:MAG: hypothetical protein M3N95_07070 [Actinomycetota bacterium]|nr:hypothetical protein [Actinomycetota bacterium]